MPWHVYSLYPMHAAISLHILVNLKEKHVVQSFFCWRLYSGLCHVNVITSVLQLHHVASRMLYRPIYHNLMSYSLISAETAYNVDKNGTVEIFV
jgi:hypothetical protein